MGKVNKTTAAVLSGALITILGVFVTLDQEVLGAIQTVVTAGMVWWISNTD